MFDDGSKKIEPVHLESQVFCQKTRFWDINLVNSIVVNGPADN